MYERDLRSDDELNTWPIRGKWIYHYRYKKNGTSTFRYKCEKL